MKKLRIFTMEDWKSEVLLEEKPVVVDFQAPWCKSLILQNQDLVKLDEEVKGDAKVFQIDVTQFPLVAMTYRLMDFPVLGLFYKGELLKTCRGIGRVREMKQMLMLCLDSYVSKYSNLQG